MHDKSKSTLVSLRGHAQQALTVMQEIHPAGQAESPHGQGTVEKVDAKTGVVTLAHDPINSLNWPAITMGFKVADVKLLDKLAEGRLVQVELKQVGSDYVINAVK